MTLAAAGISRGGVKSFLSANVPKGRMQRASGFWKNFEYFCEFFKKK